MHNNLSLLNPKRLECFWHIKLFQKLLGIYRFWWKFPVFSCSQDTTFRVQGSLRFPTNLFETSELLSSFRVDHSYGLNNIKLHDSLLMLIQQSEVCSESHLNRLFLTVKWHLLDTNEKRILLFLINKGKCEHFRSYRPIPFNFLLYLTGRAA